mmetsp:Transcript_37344/g.105360  ORF Transcript_37344/g.105360 Transcript_37344/m.105360 type:complete len:561 (-) Transcript_37344:95-1777(-)|eukprot:CAMPEP_0117650640 /NCGR_PEP_ID=MMETSP0804-20121206/1647_1 /TAXON_ID=1074897 /ORGANISM="Tetraselmis astigmatica, Strain CCMP880" /LENGTH=560 /DNA_ID=CAMNT_0005456525 /DNA_START=247 /DNA_END=1929 /DNA_ORIENTATION=-
MYRPVDTEIDGTAATATYTAGLPASAGKDAAGSLGAGHCHTTVADCLRWWRTNFWSALTMSEASGAMGDLGTFLPLTVALAQFNGLDLGTTLILTGVYNFMSGVLFQLPMPVQPMKSIAAIAVSENPLTVPEIVAAGMCVSAVVLTLGATGLINYFNRLVPPYVIRGMQLGLGLKLAQKGLRSVLYAQGSASEFRPALGVDGWLVGCSAVAFILVTTTPNVGSESEPGMPGHGEAEADCCSFQEEETETDRDVARLPVRDHEDSASLVSQDSRLNSGSARCCNGVAVPSALIVICLGLFLTVVGAPGVLSSLRLGPSVPEIVVPSLEEWRTGFLRGAIPQLPLTTLNSVVAVCHLSEELFPSKPAGPSKVAVSVGLMNLAGGWLGAMPCCHGAGGLAAQVKFGARTGAAVIFLGIVKIAIGLLFGDSLLSLLQHFPSAILGSMLIFTGAELAMSAYKQVGQHEWCMMLITAASVMTLGTATGFVVGLSLAGLVLVARCWPLDCSRGRLHELLRSAVGEQASDVHAPRGGRWCCGMFSPRIGRTSSATAATLTDSDITFSV